MNGKSTRSVLIVEDEAMVLWLARSEFEDAGYRVVEASDAETAMDILRRDPDIDLMFTDIRMPGSMDGWTLARNARQLRPDLGIIYATGFSADKAELVDGARFFVKPYRLSSVLTAASELLGALSKQNDGQA